MVISDDPATNQCGCGAIWIDLMRPEKSPGFCRVAAKRRGKWWAPGTLTNPGPVPVVTCGCGVFLRALTAGRFGCPCCGLRVKLQLCARHKGAPYNVWGIPALRFCHKVPQLEEQSGRAGAPNETERARVVTGFRIKRPWAHGPSLTPAPAPEALTPLGPTSVAEVCGLCLTTTAYFLPGHTHPPPTGASLCGLPLPGVFHCTVDERKYRM